MKHLWAPWRIEYITKVRPGGCIFCNAAKARPDKSPDESPDESDDEFQDKSDESLTLFNGRHTLVMLNKYPYNNGHLMVAPKRHVAAIEGLSAVESSDIHKLICRSVKALKKTINPGGFNIGMNLGKSAGAGIPDHLHWHIVPRWEGDTNFMPVTGETRVIPEHLAKTLLKLRPYFEGF